LVLVSLAAKAALIAPAPVPNSRRVAIEAAAMLGARGFATAFERRPLGTLLHARREGCRMLLGDYAPSGLFAVTFAERALPVGPLRFVYRGRIYTQAPKLVPVTDFYLYRELRRLGIGAERHPIVAVASRGCALPRFDWRRLAALPD
jgi:hypothetical protein